MAGEGRARDAGQADADNLLASEGAISRSLGSIKRTLGDYQQYSDIMLVATLQDCEQAGCALELNERPAFKHSPGDVARLLLNKEQEGLLTYVTDQYMCSQRRGR